MSKLDRVAKLEKELAALKQDILQDQAEVEDHWTPRDGNYIIGTGGPTNAKTWSINTAKSRSYGVTFENPESAYKAYQDFRFYHRLYKLAEELNNGWEPNWRFDSDKYYIYVDATGGEYKTRFVTRSDIQGCIYFKDKITAERAIKLITRGDV